MTHGATRYPWLVVEAPHRCPRALTYAWSLKSGKVRRTSGKSSDRMRLPHTALSERTAPDALSNYRINAFLSRVVSSVPVGTNLGLFHLLWMLLSGRLLASRSAVIPGLADFGLAATGVRRAWAALAYGCWSIAQLLTAWQQVVQDEGHWQAHRHGGYCPVACDLVGFWRPRLQRCMTKTCQRCPSVFVKSNHPPRICPQAYAGIADRKNSPLCTMIGHSPHDVHYLPESRVG